MLYTLSYRVRHIWLLTVVFIAFKSTSLHSESLSEGDSLKPIAPKRLFHSAPQQPWTTHYGIGLALTTLPREIVEEEINRAPFLDAYFQYTLAYGFSLNARINTMILTNHGSLGGQWANSYGRFSFGGGASIDMLYGFVTITGFDNTIRAWYTTPYIIVGWDFTDFSCTLRGDITYVQNERTFAGDIDVTRARNKLVTSSISLIVEQPFFGSSNLALGARLHYGTFLYQSWMAFSTYNRILLAPEIKCAFIW